MKTLRQAMVGSLTLTALILLVIGFAAMGQTNRFRRASEFNIIPMFTSNPAAMFGITNLLAESQPEFRLYSYRSRSGRHADFH